MQSHDQQAKAISVESTSRKEVWWCEGLQANDQTHVAPELGRLIVCGDEAAPAPVPRKSPAPIPHDEKDSVPLHMLQPHDRPPLHALACLL
jgi:hypothetical protein